MPSGTTHRRRKMEEEFSILFPLLNRKEKSKTTDSYQKTAERVPKGTPPDNVKSLLGKKKVEFDQELGGTKPERKPLELKIERWYRGTWRP